MPSDKKRSSLLEWAEMIARYTLVAWLAVTVWVMGSFHFGAKSSDYSRNTVETYLIITMLVAFLGCVAIIAIKREEDRRIATLNASIDTLVEEKENEEELANVYGKMIRALDNGQLRRRFVEQHPDQAEDATAFTRWVEEWVRENVSCDYADLCAELITSEGEPSA